jgi:hypothetical protein
VLDIGVGGCGVVRRFTDHGLNPKVRPFKHAIGFRRVSEIWSMDRNFLKWLIGSALWAYPHGIAARAQSLLPMCPSTPVVPNSGQEGCSNGTTVPAVSRLAVPHIRQPPTTEDPRAKRRN